MLSWDTSDAFENVHSNSTRIQYIFSPVYVCNAGVLSRNYDDIPDSHDVPSVGNGGRPISGAGRFPR